MRTRTTLALLLAVLPLISHADGDDFLGKSLEDLLNVKTEIASKKALTARESPGIISVITREDIANSGSRDLQEILTIFAPGFGFGNEVEGVVGVGMRGIWALEGRVLVTMDGLELNEEIFGTTQFGNHYPAEMIEKVEIIRGPGSVIYGGYAGLATINIVSRGVGLKGVVIEGRDSEMSHTFSHRNLTAAVGYKADDWSLDFLTTQGQGNRSQRDLTDGTGTITNLSGNQRLDPQAYNLGAKYKGLEARSILENYRTTQVSLYGTTTPFSPLLEQFKTWNNSLLYNWQVLPNLTVTPKYIYRRTEPWALTIPDGSYEFDKVSTRQRYGLNVDWDIRSNMRLLSGVEYSTLQVTTDHGKAPLDNFNYGKSFLSNTFWSYFSEFNYETDFGNFIVGGRFEKPDAFRSAFVPRVGYTRAWDQLHFKLMYSQSYRTPAGILPNRTVTADTRLSPEIATTLETEVGYKISSRSFVSVNLYDISIRDALIYIPAATGYYANHGNIGTRGIEGEYRFRETRYDLAANIAIYQRKKADYTPDEVPGHEGSTIGFANERLNLSGGYHFTRQLGLFPTVSYFGKRYSHDVRNAGAIREVHPQTLTNLNLRYEDLFVPGLSLSAGVMNIFNQDFDIEQGYDNGIEPFPSLSRAYNFMVSYQLGF